MVHHKMVTSKMYHSTKEAVPGAKISSTQYREGQYQGKLDQE